MGKGGAGHRGDGKSGEKCRELDHCGEDEGIVKVKGSVDKREKICVYFPYCLAGLL